MSSWLDGPECAFLASVCVEEKYCFCPPIYISLNSERLRLCIFFGLFRPFFGARKDGIDPLPPFYLLQVVYLIQLYIPWGTFSCTAQPTYSQMNSSMPVMFQMGSFEFIVNDINYILLPYLFHTTELSVFKAIWSS